MNASPLKASELAVQELWQLCNVLRDDGISAQDYVNELTYLLFLKMMKETSRDTLLPEGARWIDLVRAELPLDAYRRALALLDDERGASIRGLFAGARTAIRNEANLQTLLLAIDGMDWFATDAERLGDVYEGLLEKVATDRKSAAGQYFTPRPLVECMVRLVRPAAGEMVQDPAAGTGGFLISAHASLEPTKAHLTRFSGMELVPDTFRLLVMNLMLHGVDTSDVRLGDTLTGDGLELPRADVVLTNPPFGISRGGRRPSRGDFAITNRSSNKQLGFVEHVLNSLVPGGRAAIVVPDNVLFAGGAASVLRTWLLDESDLHTILKLPSGIFYAQGVKTSVLFLRRNGSGRTGTERTWIYDMRAGLPAFGRARPLRSSDFDEFIVAFGKDPDGRSERDPAASPAGRFRPFTREELRERDDKLDVTWMGAIDASEEAFDDMADILGAARDHLQRALVGLDELGLLLEESA